MYSIILCGGSGSRLWPLSRELFPKQLLNLTDDKSLLQTTYLRLKNLMPEENIFAVTSEKYYSDVIYQLKTFCENPQVLTEPIPRNTAPAVGVGVKFIKENAQKDDTIIVMPSDHYIKDLDAFNSAVKEAEVLANQGYIVTFGIKPTYAETGFGYIHSNGNEVKEFVEKPDRKTAQKYIDDGNYYWNGGIFMFKASTMLEEMSIHSPEISKLIETTSFDGHKIEKSTFEKMPKISIDYAVMEKTKKIRMVKLDCGWSDVGNFKSLHEINPKDLHNNVIKGNVINKDCENSLLYSSSKLVCAIGLNDTVIIETPDAVLACKKEDAQEVKNIFEVLKANEEKSIVQHKTVYRPWGFYTNICESDTYLIKRILVNPRQALSIQSHNHRSEHWTVIKGKAKVVLGEDELFLNVGNSVDIPLKAIHSLQNPYDEPLEIIEVQQGSILREDDIVRYSDMYGRC